MPKEEKKYFLHKKKAIEKVFLCFLVTILSLLSAKSIIKTTNIAKAQSTPWFDSSWNYRQKITVNHTMVANTNQFDFPVLITKVDDNLKSLTYNGHVGQIDGGDFVFTSADGTTKLNHEIEKYDPATGQLLAWISVPILSSTTDTTVYLYYGNQNSPKQWNLAETWKNSFKAAWHLNEKGNGILNEFKDSLGISNGQGGAGKIANVPQQTIGKISNAQLFSGTSLIEALNTNNLNIVGNAITLESWIKYDNTSTTYQGILSKDGYSSGYRLLIAPNSKLLFQLTGSSYYLTSATSLQKGLWYHLVATYDGAKMKIFINGLKDNNEKARTGNIAQTSDRLWLGMGDYNCLGQGWCYPFKNTIDEVRISNVARSADWIKTEYLNQSNPSSFITFDNETSYFQSTPTPTSTPIPTLTPTITPTPSSTPTLIPTPTSTAIPTSTPTLSPIEWNYKITIPASDHQDYGLSYPATYVFNLPPGTSEATVLKKYLSSDNWLSLPEKTSSELFNGVEAVRFDFPANKAYVSVAFSDKSEEIYLRFEDPLSNRISATFNRISQYYDNRKAVTVFTADDWFPYYSYPEFITAANEFQARNLWLTVGIVTNGHYLASWAGIQKELNEGFIEPASHSRTHSHLPFSDYDSEIGGSLLEIKNNLILPPLNRKGTSEYVYAWIEPYCEIDDIVRQKLGYYKYLTDRGNWASTAFPAWDSTNGTYGRTFVNMWIDPRGSYDVNTLNSAFDGAYQNSGIYHALFHPVNMDWSANSNLLRHLDYVKGRTDVWYVGFGHLYVYHYLQERNKVSIIPSI